MRLIDADAIQMPKTGMEVFETCRLCETAFPKIVNEIISKAPTIEPKRGEWIEENGRVICSECRCNALRTMTGCLMDRHLDYNKSNFCPNCGADMRKGSK